MFFDIVEDIPHNFLLLVLPAAYQNYKYPYTLLLHMAHITLSIPEDVYKGMKRHPEIKWSEIARKSIIKYLNELKERRVMESAEIMEVLDKEAVEDLRNMPADRMKEMYGEMVEKEWKRLKSLIQTS